ncbi:division/outer membrane stress-associated lipid-binding lipoprotein [Rodentibacter caecimuris]|uniref:Osmotically-inducible protein OsmY n=1 Tax=Rodentibacter caecimuris TaxID=1796644 RepID=A0ABX3L035_9PAST|nr:osmotically-inducible protein OsmY [Rodentibacter heylii]
MKLTQLKKLAFILSTSILLQGCVAALIGGGAAATKIGTDPRTIGTQVDDETLEFKVENAIEKDEQIKSEARINAISYSGRILLIGQVPSESTKETAESLARGVNGVTDIYNELRVSPKISIGQITKDSWITTQVKSKMLIHDQVKTTDVKVITENGEVFLLGNLTQNQGDAAAQVASKISGVVKVIKVFKYIN